MHFRNASDYNNYPNVVNEYPSTFFNIQADNPSFYNKKLKYSVLKQHFE